MQRIQEKSLRFQFKMGDENNWSESLGSTVDKALSIALHLFLTTKLWVKKEQAVLGESITNKTFFINVFIPCKQEF